MQVALLTAQNYASIETPIKAEQFMTMHFNLAILTDDKASTRLVDAPTSETGIPASEPPTPVSAKETICKTLHPNSRANKWDRSTQLTSTVVPTYRAEPGPVMRIPAGYESDNSWDFSDVGEADCSQVSWPTQLIAYTSWRGRPHRGREQSYGRGNNIAVRGGNPRGRLERFMNIIWNYCLLLLALCCFYPVEIGDSHVSSANDDILIQCAINWINNFNVSSVVYSTIQCIILMSFQIFIMQCIIY